MGEVDKGGVANAANEWTEDDDVVPSVSSLIFLRTKCLMYMSLCRRRKINQSLMILTKFRHNFEVLYLDHQFLQCPTNDELMVVRVR